MCTQADVTRIEGKLDKIDEKLDALGERDNAIEVRMTRLEERWKALSVVGVILIGIGTMAAPFVHSLLNIGG